MRGNRSEQDDLRAGPPKALSEIMTPGAEVEPVTSLGMDAIDLEKFMHEMVTIYVHPTREKGTLDVITPNANGINQPIIRGVNTPVRRKYVEALARCHSIRYEQRVQNPSQPENIQMVEKRVPDYPFDVVEDTKLGKEWLKKIYASI
jgi:hypothetical protein